MGYGNSCTTPKVLKTVEFTSNGWVISQVVLEKEKSEWLQNRCFNSFIVSYL